MLFGGDPTAASGGGAGDRAPARCPPRAVAADGLADVVELLVATGLASSQRATRRLLEQRGVRRNGRQLSAPTTAGASVPLLHGRYVLLRKGKHAYHLVEVWR